MCVIPSNVGNRKLLKIAQQANSKVKGGKEVIPRSKSELKNCPLFLMGTVMRCSDLTAVVCIIKK